jgi:para-aminobenzoate synthetase component I
MTHAVRITHPATIKEVLAALIEQPVITALCGNNHTVIAWDDNPDCVQLSRTLPPDDAHTQALDNNYGTTWGAVPASAVFVQLDYEYPSTPAQIITPRYRVWWNDKKELWANDAKTAALLTTHLATTKLLPLISFVRPLQPAWSRDYYAQHVAIIRQFIAQGDCYQANLTMPFTAELAHHAHNDIALFLQLLQHSPAPYAGFFRTPQRPSIISHSPECFLTQRGRTIVSVPIKGTRRRIADADQRIKHELQISEKDRAELAMIVDLVRNDLGHVAVPGSVQVQHDGHMIDLPHVHHRATRVSATLRHDAHFRDVIASSFPAGSITGAPKIRAMHILRDLEQQPRGPYCGAFGWIGNGCADLAVAIRSATLQHNQLQFHAGGGIVWDSEATSEWDEIHAKASGFARAIGAWS